MGQYYIIVNLDKKQYLRPTAFGDGLKLMEFGASSAGTMLALAVLLASGNGRGGGDLHCPEDTPLVGSWAGDRIVITGDYADNGLYGVQGNLFFHAPKHFEDISDSIIKIIQDNDGCYMQNLDPSLSYKNRINSFWDKYKREVELIESTSPENLRYWQSVGKTYKKFIHTLAERMSVIAQEIPVPESLKEQLEMIRENEFEGKGKWIRTLFLNKKLHRALELKSPEIGEWEVED